VQFCIVGTTYAFNTLGVFGGIERCRTKEAGVECKECGCTDTTLLTLGADVSASQKKSGKNGEHGVRIVP
jgi:hypothetical protein